MNIMRSWGVENLAQSTELFAKQQVKHHSVIHLKDDMMLLFLCSVKCPFQEQYLQQNMFNAGEQVKRQDLWKK